MKKLFREIPVGARFKFATKDSKFVFRKTDTNKIIPVENWPEHFNQNEVTYEPHFPEVTKFHVL
jgi:hypothetical protein